MTSNGPRFIDETPPAIPAPKTGVAGPESPEPDLPRGPRLLDPEPDAASALRGAWEPETMAPARSGVGSTVWALAGIAIVATSMVLFSCVAIVLSMADRSLLLGGFATVTIVTGLGLIGYGLAGEWRSYQRLKVVDTGRATLTQYGQPIDRLRETGFAWIKLIAGELPDAAAVEESLRNAGTPEAVSAILRNRVAAPLRASAMQIGRQAALEAGALIAISPHASWDGLIAGARGLAVIRQVARLYGLRPGPAVTLALVRKVAWTAAGTTGLDLLSQSLADHALSSLPVARQVARILPGTSLAAMRLYRLAGVTAEACCPLAASEK